MSDAKPPQDLSMDEILATIRRIIAEDERSSGTAARGAPAGVSSPGMSPLGPPDERAADRPREAVQAPTTPAGASDVLDLTDALDEDGGEHPVAPLRTASAPDAPLPAPPHIETEAAEPTAVETKPGEAGPRTDRPPPAEASPESDRAADAGPIPPAAPSPAAPPAAANDERLVSDVAALAAATAFGRLAAAPRVRREPPLVGGRPLDDIVRDLLRPLLRTWLDENLPGIVERLVEAELARISARSGPG